LNSRLAYVGTFQFPEGNAAAFRVLGIAKALRATGWQIVFGGGEQSPRAQDLRPDGVHEFEGFEYFSQNEFRTEHLGPLARMRRYLQVGSNTVRWLRSQDASGLGGIILYDGASLLQLRVGALAKSLGIPLLVDHTEWYDPVGHVGGRFGLVRWDVELALRCLAPKAAGAFVISSHLERHFRRSACPALRVPPLLDLEQDKWRSLQRCDTQKHGLRLVFAGHAGNKDYVVNAIRGLAELGAEGKDVMLVMVGPTRGEFQDSLGGDAVLLERLAGQLEFSGRLPHREALQRLAQCDFSLMLRPNARYAHAGFPTKLVESLACGVPILGNATSDIGMYVHDGSEGIVMEDCSPAAFVGGLKKALLLTTDQRSEMRAKARRRAEESFDFRHWTRPLEKFVRGVINTHKERKV